MLFNKKVVIGSLAAATLLASTTAASVASVSADEYGNFGGPGAAPMYNPTPDYGYSDPYAGGYSDPYAGGYTDPYAGGYTETYVDPYAGYSETYVDPYTGTYTDPYAEAAAYTEETVYTEDTTYTTDSSENLYPTGQCTWGVKSVATWASNYWGNAGDWAANAAADGYTVGTTAQVGSIICWTNAATYGHVAYVTDVAADGTIQVLESNYAGNMEIANYRGYFDPTTTGEGSVSYIYPY